MKTELSHDKIALYKSEKLFILFYDHLILFLPYFVFPIDSPPFSLPYYFISLTYSSLPPNSFILLDLSRR